MSIEWDYSTENGMTTERETAILERAIDVYGAKMQVIVAIEEMSELQQALSKWIRFKCGKPHVREEIADVGIMLRQLELIFGDCTAWEIEKLERLEERLGWHSTKSGEAIEREETDDEQ